MSNEEGITVWVLTESGDLINLDHFYGIGIRWRYDDLITVVARNDYGFSAELCTCEDEEQARRIIGRIAGAIESGVVVYDIFDAKT